VVRANFDVEPGMTVKSYNRGAFTENGIQQADIRVKDIQGGLPRPVDVEQMLQLCEGLVEPDTRHRQARAVYVHCKGGFGRSVVLAACLAIDHFDVSGALVLPWCRIARPGAITTRTQELFLKSLKGRNDLRRFARMAGPVDVDCQPTCGLTAKIFAYMEALTPRGLHLSVPRAVPVQRTVSTPEPAAALHAEQPQAAKVAIAVLAHSDYDQSTGQSDNQSKPFEI